MKKTKVINSNIFRVIAQMGHSDRSSIGDVGMPVPRTTEKIDLAVTNGVPSFMEALNNVLEELAVQRIYLAEEIKTENPDMLAAIKTRLPETPISFTPHTEIKAENPDMLAAIKTRLPETPISFTPHTEMKQKLNNCRAFIRIGEMTPYANILLESNVVF